MGCAEGGGGRRAQLFAAIIFILTQHLCLCHGHPHALQPRSGSPAPHHSPCCLPSSGSVWSSSLGPAVWVLHGTVWVAAGCAQQSHWQNGERIHCQKGHAHCSAASRPTRCGNLQG